MTEGRAYWLAEFIMYQFAIRTQQNKKRSYGETKEEFRDSVYRNYDPHAMTELAELILKVDKLK